MNNSTFNTIDDSDPGEDDESVEAYCVRCKHTVDMENPEPVWTSKGTPGTRGVCPDCGTTVFRMGRTPAHDRLVRPAAVKVQGSTKIALDGGRKRAQPATYINHADADLEFAKKLATDLENAGIHTWINLEESGETAPKVSWAGGVHPALKDSAKMVVVFSPNAQKSETVAQGWAFFKSQKKPITLVLLGNVDVPDDLRRSPRFDFSGDYKSAFRQLLSALSE